MVRSRPWLSCTLAPSSARISLASWLPGTASAWPAAVIPMASRSTPTEDGPRSTRSPTKTSLRPSGWWASTGFPASSRVTS